MIKAIREHISVKLLVSYLVVLLVSGIVLALAVTFTAPEAYSRHMQMSSNFIGDGTHTPGAMMGQGRGSGYGPGPGPGAGFADFRAGVFESLGYAVVFVVLVAVVVSVVFSRQIVAPLRALMSASQRIADGRYTERVQVSGTDELSQLAERFNRMAERLEETETRRLQMIGDVSHELRTPLTAISGYMEAMTDGVLPASPETYEQVRLEASRLSRLVDDLQELSRVEAGAYHLDLQPVSLADLVRTTAKRLSKQYLDKQVRLDVSGLDAALPAVLADQDRLIQVLTNLLGNALIYTPAGGDVKVSAVLGTLEIQVSVQDSGLGISSENMERIFDRFYRVDQSRSRAGGGGSGIGLTIAKALVDAHGGRIWVTSPGEGQGSTIFFTLPTAR